MVNRIGQPEPTGPNLTAVIVALATALFMGLPLVALILTLILR